MTEVTITTKKGEHDEATCIVRSNDIYLVDVLEMCKRAMRGAGYCVEHGDE